MNIIWVNHASYIFEHKNINLICDPWIEGGVFNNGWKLLAKSKFSYEDFSNITHIWFSHEHPDHFSPPNLKKIEKKYRSQITVLYQETKDKKLINFCKKLDFKVVEIPENESIHISDDVSLICKKLIRRNVGAAFYSYCSGCCCSPSSTNNTLISLSNWRW